MAESKQGAQPELNNSQRIRSAGSPESRHAKAGRKTLQEKIDIKWRFKVPPLYCLKISYPQVLCWAALHAGPNKGGPLQRRHDFLVGDDTSLLPEGGLPSPDRGEPEAQKARKDGPAEEGEDYLGHPVSLLIDL